LKTDNQASPSLTFGGHSISAAKPLCVCITINTPRAIKLQSFEQNAQLSGLWADR